MSYEINTYNPSEVILNISGYTVRGWSDITLKTSSPYFKPVKGIRGKHTRVRDLDSSATLTISVMQTHQTNDYLSEILIQDVKRGTGRLEIALQDRSGNTRFATAEAYITGYPSISFKEDIEYRVWEIFCQSTEDSEDGFVVGGNDKPRNDFIKEALKLFN